MNDNHSDVAEQLAIWLTEAGFRGDLSALVAGILDLRSGFEDIENRILPALLELNHDQKEEIMTLVVDLWLKSEHLTKHAEDLRNIAEEVRDFFDTNEAP